MMEVFGFDLGPIIPFILIGFAAQMVDGALGMAFGVVTNTLMVGLLGVPPALASHASCITSPRRRTTRSPSSKPSASAAANAVNSPSDKPAVASNANPGACSRSSCSAIQPTR